MKEAQSGDLLLRGRVLICPGSRHLKVKAPAAGQCGFAERRAAHSTDIVPPPTCFFDSVAEEFGPQTVGVLMTGMGDDGAEGMGAVKAVGGMTIAQSEESCVVFGMPKAAIDRGYAIRIVGLESWRAP